MMDGSQNMPQTLRIGYLLSQFPVVSQTFIYDEIRRSAALGADIRIISLAPPQDGIEREMLTREGVPPVTFVSNAAGRRGQVRDYCTAGLKAASRHPGAVFSPGNVLSDTVKALAVSATARDILDNIDILHCHFGQIGVIGAILKRNRLTRAKLLTTFLGNDLSSVVELRGQAYYKGLLQQGDLFLPISDCWSQRLQALGCDAGRIRVHHVGTDCSQIAFAPRQREAGEPVRLISVGRLVEKKGHEFSLQALAALKGRRPDLPLQFDIVGTGPQEAGLKQLAATLGLLDITHFHGALPHGRTLELLNQAHVFLLPSVTAADGDMEGIPVALMEAMAKGLPIISTRHSGIPELVQHERSGLLVAERDVPGLSAALETMIEASDAWPEMGRAGRDWVVAEFDMNRLVLRLHDHYRALMA
jgi:colanic acid/amylovoran biosynthesis glycosyltransferase